MNYFIIDFDSTFVQVESLDLLSSLSENKTNIKLIEDITKLGMDGEISFSESLEKRIKLIDSTVQEINKTVEKLHYLVTPSFKKNKAFLEKNRNNIFIISSGFHELIDPVVSEFGIKPENVFANNFNILNDRVSGFDSSNILSKDQGKAKLVGNMKLQGTIHVIGDGYTDYEIKKEGFADKFYLFTENIMRESLSKNADYLLKSLDQFIKLIS